jgi:hypothetical protein
MRHESRRAHRRIRTLQFLRADRAHLAGLDMSNKATRRGRFFGRRKPSLLSQKCSKSCDRSSLHDRSRIGSNGSGSSARHVNEESSLKMFDLVKIKTPASANRPGEHWLDLEASWFCGAKQQVPQALVPRARLCFRDRSRNDSCGCRLSPNIQDEAHGE